MSLPLTYQVWEDWEKHKQKRAIWHLMMNDKGNASGWTTLGTFNNYDDANRMKRVAEQCGPIHAKAMIRLLQ